MPRFIPALGALTVAVFVLCNDNPAMSATALTMTIESGNNQVVDQNRMLARPFQVRLIDLADRGDSNVGVTFTATRNNGLNAPEIVATSNAGIATYLPGFFRNAGTYTVTASAVGYNSVTFSVTVNDTPNDYDGTYYCTTFAADRSTPTVEQYSIGSHEFKILNNAISEPTPVPFEEFDGTYDPAAHTIRGFIGNGAFGVVFGTSPKPITLDAEGTARVEGNFLNLGQDGGSQPVGTWRCLRE